MKVINSESFLDYYCSELLAAVEALNYDTGNGAKYHPVFVLCLNCKTWFDNIAGKLVKGQSYWHSAIAFGPSLSTCYSFNFGEAEANARKGGLSYESLAFYQREHPDGDLYVSCIFLTQSRYKKLKENLEYYIHNKEKTKYSFINLARQFFGKNKVSKSGLDKVCSTFVDTLLKSVSVNLNDNPSDMVKPDDLHEGNEMQFTIFSGLVKDYDPMKAAKMVENMANSKQYSYFHKGGPNNEKTAATPVIKSNKKNK